MGTAATITTVDTRTTTIMAETPPLPLYVWLSPSFPVGSFAFSHGLEWLVDAGDIADARSLEAWLQDLLHYGAIRADAVRLSEVHRAPVQAPELNELALALTGSAERHLETAAQGSAFLAAVAAAWPTPDLAHWRESFEGRDVAYPVALGLAAACHAIALPATLEAFLVATIGNLVSAVLRLGPIGQSAAQATIARLVPAVRDLAAWAGGATVDDLGTCAWRSDIAAMRHETQYSRLFRS